MKLIFTIFFILFSIDGFSFSLNPSDIRMFNPFYVGTKYYVSTSGNDAANGLTPATAWQTIAKVNATTLVPGDSVLFNGGQTFYGGIVISQSGTSLNPIVFASYGTGKAKITGLSGTLWNSIGGGVWESQTLYGTTGEYLNLVLVNGNIQMRGRYPNAGTLLTYENAVGTGTGATLQDDQTLSSTVNWTGAQLVTRRNDYVWDRSNIISHSSNIFTFNLSSTGQPGDIGNGYFIQNDVRTLNQVGEWYYDPNARTLKMYFGGSTSGYTVQASTVPILANVMDKDYITFCNLQFEGADTAAIHIDSLSTNIKIKKCDFNYSGSEAIIIGDGDQFGADLVTVDSCTIRNSLSNGISSYESNGNTITNNTIVNSGLWYGAGSPVWGDFNGIQVKNRRGTNNTIVRFNRIDSSGYCGVFFNGTNTFIDSNYITNYCMLKTDGGGIYGNNKAGQTNRTVKNNIVMYGWGNIVGTLKTNPAGAVGIYLDDDTKNTIVANNIVYQNSRNGIYLHNTQFTDVKYNIAVSAMTPTDVSPRAFEAGHDVLGSRLTNLDIKNNIWLSLRSDAWSFVLDNDTAYYGPAGIDSNYYANPLNVSQTIYENHVSSRTFAQWRSSYPAYDVHGAAMGARALTTDSIRVEFNATKSTVVRSLGTDVVKDVFNVTYPNYVTLAPYSGKLLIKAGSNVLPVANAGVDDTIPYPSTLSLNGLGSTDDNPLTYSWAKTSGPAGGVIVSPSSGTTNVTGLPAGVHTFTLTVTDSYGLTSTDNVVITVAVVNINPVARAGSDINIQLPTTTATLNGSTSTDADGTITGYNWAKISGPAGGAITSPNSASSGLTALGVGTYSYKLTVTDNDGGTGLDTVNVIVAAANVAPTANAGFDKLVTLPVTTVAVVGTAFDTDGTVSSTAWTYRSGPSTPTFTPNANSLSVTIGNLAVGQYVIRLTVTDNNGATSFDEMTIFVNPAPVPNEYPVKGKLTLVPGGSQ